MHLWSSVCVLAGRVSLIRLHWVIGAVYLACALAQFTGERGPVSGHETPVAEWQLADDDGPTKVKAEVGDEDSNDHAGSIRVADPHGVETGAVSPHRSGARLWDDHPSSPDLRPPIVV